MKGTSTTVCPKWRKHVTGLFRFLIPACLHHTNFPETLRLPDTASPLVNCEAALCVFGLARNFRTGFNFCLQYLGGGGVIALIFAYMYIYIDAYQNICPGLGCIVEAPVSTALVTRLERLLQVVCSLDAELGFPGRPGGNYILPA